jgi:PTS system mannose-specific IID component
MAPVKPPLGRTLLRLFTIQSSWNYERMQGVGFGVAEEPLLRDLGRAGDSAAYRGALARGAHFFNAHPYLCGLAVGAAARAEHDGIPPAQVERLRTALCGPLGSLGDRLVWAGWLPLTSGLALAAVALGLGWWAVVGFLALYNAGHVALRWWALRAGWARGTRVAEALRQPFLRRAGAVVEPGMALAMGAALPLAAAYLGGPFPGWARMTVGIVAALGLLLLRWRRLGLTGLRLGLGAVAAALVVGWAWR